MRHLWLLFWALLSLPALADSWALPKDTEINSANGKYAVRIQPAHLRSQLDYFADKSRGKARPGMVGPHRCTGTLVERRHGKERVLWSVPLSNEVSPVEAIVADDGRFLVTFDNWHSMGYGRNVVVVYGPQGKIESQFSLEQLLNPAEIKQVETSVSSRWWRRGAWINSREGVLFIACRKPEKWLVLDLAHGKLRDGTDSDLQAALRDQTGDDLCLPLELAREHSLAAGPLLKQRLADPNLSVAVRLRVAAALKRLGDSSGTVLVETVAAPGYKGASKKDRGLALRMLPDFLGIKAIPVLREAMRGVADGEVWGQCQEAFVQLGEAAVPTLIAMLGERGSPDYRGGAAHALGHIGSKTALPALLEAIKDPDRYVADAAFHAARDIGQAEVAEPFCRLLQQGTTQDGNIAYYFLKQRHPAAAAALLQCLERHLQPSPSSRDSSEGFDVGNMVQALEYQSGVHLGRDLRAWHAWLEQGGTPGDSLQRGLSLARLGDESAGHWLARAAADHPLEAHQALSQWMNGRPRLAALLCEEERGVCALSADGRRAVLGGAERARVWDLTQGLPLTALSARLHERRYLDLSADGESVVVRDFDKIEVKDTKTGLTRARLEPRGHVDCAQLSQDGKRLAILAGNSASVWDAENGTSLDNITCGLALHASFSRDGSLLVLDSHPLLVCDLAKREQTVCEIRATEVRMLPQSQSFLACNRHLGSIGLYGLKGQLLLELERGGPDPHPSEMDKRLGMVTAGGRAIEHWAVAADGSCLALAFRDGLVRVRRLSDAKILMEAQLSEATALALSPDGTRLAVACHETGTITVFSTSDGARIGAVQFLENHGDLDLATRVWVREMAFQASGRLVIPPSEDRGMVTLWDLEPKQAPPDLDAPPELEELNVQVCTGHRLVGDQLRQMNSQEYLALKLRWSELSRQHAAKCQNQAGNLWLLWGQALPSSSAAP